MNNALSCNKLCLGKQEQNENMIGLGFSRRLIAARQGKEARSVAPSRRQQMGWAAAIMGVKTEPRFMA